MKKLIFIFLFPVFAFCQQDIEITLVNPNIGIPSPSQGSITNQSLSNDAGLNSIFTNNYVSIYQDKLGNPFQNLPLRYNVSTGPSNTTLLTQLQNYTSVIQSATACSPAHFDNMLTIKLLTNSTGTQTGTNGNIVVTNDNNLNQIFQNYSIVQMILSLPNAINNPNLNRYYYIRSSGCNLQNLKSALTSYNTVIELVENTPASAILNKISFDKKNTSIYPNPFQHELKIESSQLILNYELIDFTGKVVFITENKSEINKLLTSLITGVYVLQLKYENGFTTTHKIFKN